MCEIVDFFAFLIRKMSVSPLIVSHLAWHIVCQLHDIWQTAREARQKEGGASKSRCTWRGQFMCPKFAFVRVLHIDMVVGIWHAVYQVGRRSRLSIVVAQLPNWASLWAILKNLPTLRAFVLCGLCGQNGSFT